MNVGARVEDYTVGIDDSTVSGFPARQFWFNAYNREYCFGPGYFQPLYKGPTGTCAANFPLTTNVALVNTNPNSFSHTIFEPRFAASYEIDQADVLRFSAGLYARPASTREASWNTGQENLASFLGQNWVAYGLNTPNHDVVPDESTNLDLSYEHRFSGTALSFKVTPYYRSTQHQVQQIIVNALSGLFGSLNTGRLTSEGVEFALSDGDFSRNGFAVQVAYTYNHSQIKFDDFSNGRNVIDNMNEYVQLYNSFTKSCASAAPSSNPTAPCGVFGNMNATAPGNPYFNLAPQPLFDRTGSYEPYDLIPVPFAAANGYEVPSVATLILNYKHDKWYITPTSPTPRARPMDRRCRGPAPFRTVATPGGTAQCTTSLTVESANRAACLLMIPDPYTGKFDGFGDFKEPWRMTGNVADRLRHSRSNLSAICDLVQHHRFMQPARLRVGSAKHVPVLVAAIELLAAHRRHDRTGRGGSCPAALSLRHVAQQQQHRLRRCEVSDANKFPDRPGRCKARLENRGADVAGRSGKSLAHFL